MRRLVMITDRVAAQKKLAEKIKFNKYKMFRAKGQILAGLPSEIVQA